MKFKNPFKKQPTEIDRLLLAFLKNKGYKEFAQEQGKAMQEHNYRLRKVERNEMIKEKYEYLKFRKEKGLPLTDEQEKEYDYVKFLVERPQLHEREKK